MALKDNYAQVYDNDLQFRQRIVVQLPRTLITIAAGTAGQQAFVKQYALSRDGTVNQLVPFVAAFILNRGDANLADDAQLTQGIEQAIALLVTLGVAGV